MRHQLFDIGIVLIANVEAAHRVNDVKVGGVLCDQFCPKLSLWLLRILQRKGREIPALLAHPADFYDSQVLPQEFALLRDYRINAKKSIGHAEFRWTKHLKPFFGIYRAVQVTSEAVARYIESRQQEGAANATINRELAALKRMFRLGQQSTPPKVLRLPKIPRLREDNVRTGFLEDGQYRKLIEYCPELWFRSMVEVGRTYGWRVSEVQNMRVSQLDLLQRTIRLEPGTTKNRESREVSMIDAVYALLRECARGKAADAFVFTRPNGKPILSFRKLWAKACAFAGCPDLLFHDLRRTAARGGRIDNENRRMENSQRFRALQHYHADRHQGRYRQAPRVGESHRTAAREQFRSRFRSR